MQETEHFGSYEILRRLATGGMAEVLLAKQKGMGGFERLVCLKRILPHLSAQEDFLKMFQDEARIAANLIHPNIAQIYDIGQEGEHFYIAMEYVRGEDLRRVYNQEVERGQTIARPIAAQVIMGAAAGLDYAHRQTTLNGQPLHIVHRDISPQNIIVTYDGHVKIIDFGVAKAAGKLTHTRSGVLKGKYAYMSPEQAAGDPVNARSDIFALGITLYEITTGTRLFKRDNELDTLQAVITCRIPPPSRLIPTYESDLEAIVLKALAPDPTHRYPTAGDLEQDLERFLLHHGHPTSASALAAYMNDLFAAKLTQEALQRGSPENTASPASMQAPSLEKGFVLHATADATVVSAPLPSLPLSPLPLSPLSPLPLSPLNGASHKPSPDPASDDWQFKHESSITTVSNVPPLGPARAVAPGGGAERFPRVEPQEPQDAPSQSALPSAPPRRIRRYTWPLLSVILGGILVGGLGTFYKLGLGWGRLAGRLHLPELHRTELHPAELHPAPVPPVPGSFQALLTVTAPIPMEVTLEHRTLGDTPLRQLRMDPGTYRLKLESKHEGMVLYRQIQLKTGHHTIAAIPNRKGSLSVDATPWAWVQIGLRPSVETPVTFELLEGEYTVIVECPNGQRHTHHVAVLAPTPVNISIPCHS